MNLSKLSQCVGLYSCVVLPLVLGGCKSTGDLPEQNAQSEFSGPIDPAVYAQMAGDMSFQSVRSESFSTGYSVESGNLLGRDASMGSLILVRSPSGEVTGIIDRPDKRGTFHVGVDGTQRFTQDVPGDHENMMDTKAPLSSDSFPSESAASSDSAENQYIDALVAYSRYALEKTREDPIAYAYAMIESINLAIDNSDAGATKVRLVGVRIHEVDYTSYDLGKWHALMTPLRPQYHHDLSMAIAAWDGGIAGSGYMPGLTQANAWGAVNTPRHEFAHNIGSNHCSNGSNSYKFGYKNGKSGTATCGNSVPYLSTPLKNDAHGLPLGDAKTADTARLYRERAHEMATYQSMFKGERMILASLSAPSIAKLKIPLLGQNTGVVVLDPSIGPTALTSFPSADIQVLNVPLTGDDGKTVRVKFRAVRAIGACGWTVMNSNKACAVGTKNMYLELRYVPSDNPTLAPGHYNGTLEMKALEKNTAEAVWSPRILASITIQKK